MLTIRTKENDLLKCFWTIFDIRIFKKFDYQILHTAHILFVLSLPFEITIFSWNDYVSIIQLICVCQYYILPMLDLILSSKIMHMEFQRLIKTYTSFI